jgi:hypothetical protein
VASLLTFLRPLRHERVRSVLLLESAPIDLTLRVAARLRAIFPSCAIELVVREDDRDAVSGADFAAIMVVRWEDRLEVVRKLRRHRYDAVVVPTSHRGSDYLRALPLLLRTRAILVFNDNLDHFPLHAARLGAFAHHVSGQPSAGALLRWIAARIVLVPLTTLLLVASVTRLEMRAAWRRMRT